MAMANAPSKRRTVVRLISLLSLLIYELLIVMTMGHNVWHWFPSPTPTAGPKHPIFVPEARILQHALPGTTPAWPLGSQPILHWIAHLDGTTTDSHPAKLDLSAQVYGPFETDHSGISDEAIAIVQGDAQPTGRPVATAPVVRTDTWTDTTLEQVIPLPQTSQPGTYVCIAATHAVGPQGNLSVSSETRFIVSITAR